MADERQHSSLKILYDVVLLAFEETLDATEDLTSPESDPQLNKIKRWLENAVSSLISWGIDSRLSNGSISVVENSPLGSEIRSTLCELQRHLEKTDVYKVTEVSSNLPQHNPSIDISSLPASHQDEVLVKSDDPMATMSSLISVLQDTVKPIRMVYASRRQEGPYWNLKQQIDHIHDQHVKHGAQDSIQEKESQYTACLVENSSSEKGLIANDILSHQIESKNYSQRSNSLPLSVEESIATKHDLEDRDLHQLTSEPVDDSLKHVNTLAKVQNLASIYHGQGQYYEIEKLLQRALSGNEEKLGPKHHRMWDVATGKVDHTLEGHPGSVTTMAFSPDGSKLALGSRDKTVRVLDVATGQVDHTLESHSDWVRTVAFSPDGSELASGSWDKTDHLDRAAILSNLGNHLSRRFERTGSIDDLNYTINVTSMAVDAIPQDHPSRAGMLNNLGSHLSSRFERTRSMDDLNQAISLVSMAVDATPQDHPDRATMLSNLGNHLNRRFERTGSIDDLNRAVDVASMAVDATPQDHPDRASRLSNLGNRLSRRFERTGSMDDYDKSLHSFQTGWDCESSAPSLRIKLARRVALLLASQQNWEESSNFLQGAVKLLPLVSPRSLQHTDKQYMLADFAGLASMAAATALNAGKEAHHALQLLELGRGVIASLLLEMRTDISALRQQHPEYADQFRSLRDELDLPADGITFAASSDNVISWELPARRRREADQRFGELLIRIRAQPGFHNFLCPPTVDELMAAVDPDPIIIVNTSSYRCDAFLIERNRIKVLELPGLALNEVQKRAKELRSSRFTGSFNVIPLLEWLWDVICRPCIEALGFKDPITDGNWPRVWWIPTGVLSQLPLHAAGRHAQGPTETVLDRVMSSYSSSVKALIYGRRHQANRPIGASSDYALLAAMHKTPGLSKDCILPFAVDEVKVVKNLCVSLQLKPIEPKLRKEDVLSHLQVCRIFHFAGHGQSHPIEPSKSCLLLQDWESSPLTVGDLRDHRLQESPPFLAYLSACSTGANEADKLVDEGIHLVSALQLAGFRHVIGTLWEVSDEHCVDVAKVVYETLRDEGMTDIAVCRGLHRAIRALRDGRIERERASDDINATVAAVEDNNRDGRTATLVSCGSPPKNLWNPYWLPYVHFGV